MLPLLILKRLLILFRENCYGQFCKSKGIRGKLFRCVKSMYEVVKARVRDGASLTASIHCLRGVKQGDVCSSILFSLFMNELALDIINDGKHSAILSSTLVEIFILLFADDIILLSETAIGFSKPAKCII